MIWIFYHGEDLDGQCSGAILNYALSKQPHEEIMLYPLTYAPNTFPWDKVKPTDLVFMADISLSAAEMWTLAGKCACLTWFDHHARTIAEFDKSFPGGASSLPGVRDSSMSACALVWRYFFGDPIPEAVWLLSLYDTWNHDDKHHSWDKVEDFQYGVRAENTDPSRSWDFWHEFFRTHECSTPPWDFWPLYDEQYYKSGKVIRSYVERQASERLIMDSYIIDDWEGHRCLCINDGTIANFMTRDPAFEGCDVAIAFSRVKSGTWKFQLRSVRDDVDVSKIAQKFGGGGHKHAAGFNSDRLCLVFPYTGGF